MNRERTGQYTSRRAEIGRHVAIFGTHQRSSVRYRRSAPRCHLRRERCREAAWSRRRRGVQTQRAAWLRDSSWLRESGASSWLDDNRCQLAYSATYHLSALPLFRISAPPPPPPALLLLWLPKRYRVFRLPTETTPGIVCAKNSRFTEPKGNFCSAWDCDNQHWRDKYEIKVCK